MGLKHSTRQLRWCIIALAFTLCGMHVARAEDCGNPYIVPGEETPEDFGKCMIRTRKCKVDGVEACDRKTQKVQGFEYWRQTKRNEHGPMQPYWWAEAMTAYDLFRLMKDTWSASPWEPLPTGCACNGTVVTYGKCKLEIKNCWYYHEYTHVVYRRAHGAVKVVNLNDTRGKFESVEIAPLQLAFAAVPGFWNMMLREALALMEKQQGYKCLSATDALRAPPLPDLTLELPTGQYATLPNLPLSLAASSALAFAQKLQQQQQREQDKQEQSKQADVTTTQHEKEQQQQRQNKQADVIPTATYDTSKHAAALINERPQSNNLTAACKNTGRFRLAPSHCWIYIDVCLNSRLTFDAYGDETTAGLHVKEVDNEPQNAGFRAVATIFQQLKDYSFWNFGCNCDGVQLTLSEKCHLEFKLCWYFKDWQEVAKKEKAVPNIRTTVSNTWETPDGKVHSYYRWYMDPVRANATDIAAAFYYALQQVETGQGYRCLTSASPATMPKIELRLPDMSQMQWPSFMK